jgi:hypothetical protein
MAIGTYERPAFDPEMAQRLQKPAKGTATVARQAKRTDIKKHEREVKEAITRRDGQKVCRLDPNCQHVKKGVRVEGVHLDSKGMAGDHGVRTQSDLMLRGCFIHHQGVRSIHSGDLRVKFLTAKKADGPIALLRKEVEFIGATRRRREVWVEFAREKAINVWEVAK